MSELLEKSHKGVVLMQRKNKPAADADGPRNTPSQKTETVCSGLDPIEVLCATYRILLGREPDEDGLLHYLSTLKQTEDFGAILSSFIDSEEHKSKQKVREIAPLLVDMVFRGLLGRSADTDGLEHYTKITKATGDIAGVLAAVIQSDEFRTLRRMDVAPDQILKGRRGVIIDVLAQPSCLVFLHIQKTAGTTIQHMLTDAFGEKNVYHEHGDTLFWRSPSELSSFTVFAGHFNYDSLTYLPRKNAKIITFLRDPKKRLVSLYVFWKAHTSDAPGYHIGMELANQCDINEFFGHKQIIDSADVWNHMTWSIMGHHQWSVWRELLESLVGKERNALLSKIRTAIRHRLQEFLFVGLQESFERSVNLLFGLIERPIPAFSVVHSVEQLSATHSYFKIATKPEITPEVDQKLSCLLELDDIVYQEGKLLFEKQMTTS